MFSKRIISCYFRYKSSFGSLSNQSKPQFKKNLGEVFEEALKNKSRSIEDWANIRENLLKVNTRLISPQNIDAMLLGYCTSMRDFETAHSYVGFLTASKIEPNLATLGRILKLLYFSKPEPNSKVENQIFEMYEKLKKDYPVLDSITLENVLLAFSITKQWRKCFEIKEEISLTTKPTGEVYNALASAAFRNGEDVLGWNEVTEGIQNNKILDPAFISYLKTIYPSSNENATKKLLHLFTFFNENDVIPKSETVHEIGNVCLNKKFKFTKTSINFRESTCNSCGNVLKQFELTDKEFEILKEGVLKNVIVGKDIFIKTDPAELAKFQSFIADMPQFDVVLDGLNIAYSVGVKQDPFVFSALLAAVVRHFRTKNKKVLVLGRVHMNRWPKKYWSYVQNNSTIFLTQNISQDDPYLLYCALNSGKNTDIITRDLMRSHKFLLKDWKLKSLFERWLSQRKHQLLRVTDKGEPIFKPPQNFTVLAQKNKDFWHIPFLDESKEHPNWACIKL